MEYDAAGSSPLVVCLQVPRLPLPPGPRAAVRTHHAVLAHPGRQAGLHHHHGGTTGGPSVHSEHSSPGTTSPSNTSVNAAMLRSVYMEQRQYLFVTPSLSSPLPVCLYSPVHKGPPRMKARCGYIQSQCKDVNSCKCLSNKFKNMYRLF